jgi:microsomal epoxide hydrolase
MAGYDTIPESARVRPDKFTLSISDEKLSHFKDLLRLSPLAPRTYENLQSEGKYGMTYDWMSKGKEYWEKQYDWWVDARASYPRCFIIMR